MEEVKEPNNLLSEQEAAKRCGVSRITLLRARKAGKIPLLSNRDPGIVFPSSDRRVSIERRRRQEESKSFLTALR